MWIAARTPNEYFDKKKDFAQIRDFGKGNFTFIGKWPAIRGSSVWEAVIELNSSSFW